MNEQLLQWDDLHTVLAIAETGSLSGAARRLDVSHSTVFRRLAKIEQRLEVVLFERSRRGYSPTLAGEDLARTAADIDQQVDGVARRLAGQDQSLAGVIRATTTDTLLHGLLMPVFADFQRQYPDVILEISVSNRRYDLLARDADVAIRPSNTPPETLIGRCVGTLEQAIYVAAQGAMATDVAPTLDWIWIDEGPRPDDVPLALWMQRHGYDDQVGYRCDTLMGRRDAARSGLGAAVLPCYLGDADGQLMRVGETLDELSVNLWLLAHEDLRRVTRIRRFLGFIADALTSRL